MYFVNGVEGSCRAKHKVTVVSGETVSADVYCEMK